MLQRHPLLPLSTLLAYTPMVRPTIAIGRTKPNILLILTDDTGWPTLGGYGGKIVPSPNIDRVAAEGARFTDAHVTSQCTPTRASIMSGQDTARNGMWHAVGWHGLPWAPMQERPFVENHPRDAFTIAEGLKTSGYATGFMGLSSRLRRSNRSIANSGIRWQRLQQGGLPRRLGAPRPFHRASGGQAR